MSPGLYSRPLKQIRSENPMIKPKNGAKLRNALQVLDTLALAGLVIVPASPDAQNAQSWFRGGKHPPSQCNHGLHGNDLGRKLILRNQGLLYVGFTGLNYAPN